jgi:hypothetical protein
MGPYKNCMLYGSRFLSTHNNSIFNTWYYNIWRNRTNPERKNVYKKWEDYYIEGAAREMIKE